MLFSKDYASELPTLANTGEDDRDALLQAVASLVATVKEAELSEPEQLRGAWPGGADGFDKALSLAKEMGLLLEVPSASPASRSLLPSPPAAVLEGLGKDDLSTLARIYDVEGRSKMGKDELIVALRAVGQGPSVPQVVPGFVPPSELMATQTAPEEDAQ